MWECCSCSFIIQNCIPHFSHRICMNLHCVAKPMIVNETNHFKIGKVCTQFCPFFHQCNHCICVIQKFVAPWERDQRNLYAPNVYAEMLVDAKVVLEQSQDQGFTIKIQIFQLINILHLSSETRIDCEFDDLSQRKNHLKMLLRIHLQYSSQ